MDVITEESENSKNTERITSKIQQNEEMMFDDKNIRREIIQQFQEIDQQELEKYVLQLKAEFVNQCRRQYYRGNDPDLNLYQIQVEVNNYKWEQLNLLRKQFEEQKNLQLSKLQILQDSLAEQLNHVQPKKILYVPERTQIINFEPELKQILMHHSDKFDVSFKVWLEELRDFVSKNKVNNQLQSLIEQISELEFIDLDSKRVILKKIQEQQNQGQKTPKVDISMQFSEQFTLNDLTAKALLQKQIFRQTINNQSQNLTKFKKDISLQKLGLNKYNVQNIR